MPHNIVDGEFPDDEITDIAYMVESNDSLEELLADLRREDDGPETTVRLDDKKLLLTNVVRALESLQGTPYNAEVIKKILWIL